MYKSFEKKKKQSFLIFIYNLFIFKVTQVMSSTESLKSKTTKPSSSRNPASNSEHLNEAPKSTSSLYSPAFVHLSSPKLSKIGYNKMHKSQNRPVFIVFSLYFKTD